MERPMLGTGCPLFDLLANDLGSLWRLTSLRWCLTVLTELLDVIGSTLRLFDNGSQRPSDVLSSSLRSREQSPRPSGRCASFSNSDCDSLFSRWNWIWELLSSDRVFPSRPKSEFSIYSLLYYCSSLFFCFSIILVYFNRFYVLCIAIDGL